MFAHSYAPSRRASARAGSRPETGTVAGKGTL
jgi:hypothetical protein